MKTITACSLSDLEDALYIEHELTPTNRDWRDDMRFFGHTEFDYHECEFVRVTALGDNRFGLTEVLRA